MADERAPSGDPGNPKGHDDLRLNGPRSDQWLTPGRLAALIAVLLGAYAGLIIIRTLRGVLLMLLVALFLSFAMEPAVQFLARRGWRRGAATGAVFLLAFFLGVGVVAAMIPLVVDQVTALIQSIPRSIEELNRLLSTLPLPIDLEASPELEGELEQIATGLGDWLRERALGAAGGVVDVGATALGVLVRGLAIAFITFYLVADGPRLRQTLARPLPPARQRELLAIWEVAVAKTGGYIYSRLIIGMASAVAHTLLLLVVGIPYPLPLGIWMGIMTAFVPLIGVPLGGTVLVLVAVTHDPIDGLWVLGFILAYQQVENYLLAPKIQAHTMDLHPAVAFTSVLAGGALLGAIGVLLALPAAAITKALLSTYVRRHELIEELAEIDVGPAARAPLPAEVESEPSEPQQRRSTEEEVPQ